MSAKFFGLTRRRILMKKSEGRILETLVRVRQHGLARASVFPDGARARKLYEDVDAAVAKMERHATQQTIHAHAAKEKTAQNRAADKALRRLMEAVSRTARTMSRRVPGLEEKFRLPSNKDRLTWLAAGRAFAKEAEPIKDEFIQRGLSADFVEDLKARVAAVEQLTDGRAQQSAGRVASTAGVAEAAEEGLAAVRELDVIMRNVYADSPTELAEWESASRVERPARRAQTKAPPAQPDPSGA
jgi:hypothetical protein